MSDTPTPERPMTRQERTALDRYCWSEVLGNRTRAPQPVTVWVILWMLFVGVLIGLSIGYLRWGRLLEEAQRRVQMEERL